MTYKVSRFYVLVALVCASVFVASAHAADLTVTLTNIESDKGQVVISVFDTKKTFKDKSDPIASITIPASQGHVLVSFTDLPTTPIALAAFHDANTNNKMDTNFLGAPKEGFAVSNNAKGRFGPPTYEDARFTMSDDTLAIEMAMQN